MKVLAHRGYSGKYPENTMLAFRKAVEAGADGIELDVHLTRDGELVVFHDDSVERTTDGIGEIRNLNYKELRTLNAAKLFSDQFSAEKIPAFEEYCQWAKEQPIVTNVEIKTDNCYYAGIEDKTWDMIVKYGLEDRVILSSFNHLSLLRLKEILPSQVQLGALVLEEGGIRTYPGDYCRMAGFHAWHPPFEVLNDENIKNCQDQGVDINVWTVNELDDVKKLHAWNCTSVITNYPEMAVNWLKQGAIY